MDVKKPLAKILFILKKRSAYGVSYGLINSCKFVADALQSYNIESKIVQVVDNSEIDKEVFNYRPTHVFVEALWVVPEKFEELFKFKHNRDAKWSVRLHSQAPFLGTEGIAFEWIRKYNQLSKKYSNFRTSSNSKRLIKDLGTALGFKLNYAPNIYSFDKKSYPFLWQNTIVNIGCFGAIRPFKNHLNQALAALTFAKKNNLKLNFHVNSSRFENVGESVLKNLRNIFLGSHSLVEHDWTSHEDFIELVRTMDLGMQVSYTETFNIVAADFVSNHIPFIGSKEIDWLHSWYQADPNDVQNISNKLDFAYFAKVLHIHRLNEWGLQDYNQESIRAWTDLIL